MGYLEERGMVSLVTSDSWQHIPSASQAWETHEDAHKLRTMAFDANI